MSLHGIAQQAMTVSVVLGVPHRRATAPLLAGVPIPTMSSSDDIFFPRGFMQRIEMLRHETENYPGSSPP